MHPIDAEQWLRAYLMQVLGVPVQYTDAELPAGDRVYAQLELIDRRDGRALSTATYLYRLTLRSPAETELPLARRQLTYYRRLLDRAFRPVGTLRDASPYASLTAELTQVLPTEIEYTLYAEIDHANDDHA